MVETGVFIKETVMPAKVLDLLPPMPVHVLVISGENDDHELLRSIIGHSNWTLYTASNRSEALELLRDNNIPVIICERDLPDGTWKDVLAEVGSFSRPPHLLVTSRLADDRLWAEVLNVGGYDVLAKPFVPAEVFRTISLAWLNWKDVKRAAAASAA